MRQAIIKSVIQVTDGLELLVDFHGSDDAPLTLPGYRDLIADAVAKALGQPLAPDPDPVPLLGHSVHVSAEAIGSRMAMYSFATPKEALEAIVREHLSRLSPDVIDPTVREELVERVLHGDIGAMPVAGLELTDDGLKQFADDIEHARLVRT